MRLRRTARSGRRSRVVLTPRRRRQVGERNFTGDGDKQARSPGRARNRLLKPSRAGMPGDLGATVVTNSCAFYTLRTRLRVRRAPRHSPRPLWASDCSKNPGAMRRGNVKVCLDVGCHAGFHSFVIPGCATWRRPQMCNCTSGNPYSLQGLWIPGSLASLAPRNDEVIFVVAV
jgi:hypothetical protein